MKVTAADWIITFFALANLGFTAWVWRQNRKLDRELKEKFLADMMRPLVRRMPE